MRRFQILFLLCFTALLLTPLAFTTLQPDAASQVDNRMLAPVPQTFEDWQSEIETVLKDRLGFREDIILFYRQAMYRLFNILEHPLFVSGKNGHLYRGDLPALDVRQSFYEDADLKRVQYNIEKLYQYLQSKGKAFLFVFMPMKQGVYPEFVPSYYTKSPKPMLSEILERKLEESGIPHIFLTNTLLQYKTNSPTYNQKYDPGHFNAIGAFVAHEAISHKLKAFYPDYPLLQWSAFEQSTRMADLSLYFLKNTKEKVPVLKRISRDFKLENLTDGILDVVISTKEHAPVKKTLFLICDSFMFYETIYASDYGALDYYGHAFEKVYLIPIIQATLNNNIYALIDRYQPDIVLYEAAEARLLDNVHFTWENTP